MDKTKVTKDLPNKTLTIERTFDAPKEKLWQVYANKDMFEKWWGPEGWQTTTKTFDFRSGGSIHYGMKCVDQSQSEWFGKESWGIMKIESVNAPNDFEARDYFADAQGTINNEMPNQKFVVELTEEGGKTRLTTRCITNTTEELEQLLNMGMVDGFSSQLNRLETLLRG